MLQASAWLLGLTTLGGLLLLALLQWNRPSGRVWLPGAAHGLAGVLGFVLLVFGLGGPPRGTQTGSASFGLIAATLIALALALGLLAFAARLGGRRAPPLALGVHATLGVAGLVILAAYLAAPP